MDFLDYLKTSASEVDQALNRLFQSWRREIKHVNPKVLKLLEISIKASEGGKRLRGTMVKLGFELAQDVAGPVGPFPRPMSSLLTVAAGTRRGSPGARVRIAQG